MRSKQEEVDVLSAGKKTFFQVVKGFIGQQKDVSTLMAEIEEVPLQFNLFKIV
jgi:hypothetical protein